MRVSACFCVLALLASSCRTSPSPAEQPPGSRTGAQAEQPTRSGERAPEANTHDELSPAEKLRLEAAASTAGINVSRMFVPFAGAVDTLPCDLEPSGQTEIVPPLSMRCARGPNGECWPKDEPTQPWEYGPEAWAHPVWKLIEGRLPVEGHHYHFAMRWTSVEHEDRFCSCRYTTMAFGDLDDDQVFSTFEMTNDCSGSGDPSKWTNKFE